MAATDRTTPSAPDPKAGRNPGYDEANPRDRGDLPKDRRDSRDAQDGKLPNPDAGGLDREPTVRPDPAAE